MDITEIDVLKAMKNNGMIRIPFVYRMKHLKFDPLTKTHTFFALIQSEEVEFDIIRISYEMGSVGPIADFYPTHYETFSDLGNAIEFFDKL